MQWIRLLLLPAVLLLAIACGAENGTDDGMAPADTPAEQVSTTVDLTMDARLEGDALIIEGTTDLLDGALIAYEARHGRLATDTEVPLEQMFADGNIPVSDGSYRTTVDVTDWPEGAIEVWVAFQTMLKGDQQPAEIIERFGELGENLEGPNVTESGELKRVELTKTVQR